MTGTPPSVEVMPTPAHGRNRARFNTVARRAPDSCLTEGAATASGMSNSSKTIMRTESGVWFAELERALTGAGYRVISWNALQLAERQKRISTYEAARELGAQVVFMLNSLELNPVRAGRSARTSTRYFASDERGENRGPRPLPEADRAALRTFISQRFATMSSEVLALAATLDTTAISVENGDSIWFYRHSLTKPLQQAAGRRFLFSRLDGTWHVAQPQLPRMHAPAVADVASEDVARPRPRPERPTRTRPMSSTSCAPARAPRSPASPPRTPHP